MNWFKGPKNMLDIEKDPYMIILVCVNQPDKKWHIYWLITKN